MARTQRGVATKATPDTTPKSSRPRRSTGSTSKTPTRSKPTTPTSAKSKIAKSLTTSANKKSSKPLSKAKVDEGEEDEGDQGRRSHSPTGMTETEEDTSSSDGDSGDAFDPPSEDEEVDDEQTETESEIDSDNLDDDDDEGEGSNNKSRKRKSVGSGGGGGAGSSGPGVGGKKVKSEKGKAKAKKEDESDEEEFDEDEVELEEGQEIAGRIYPAPKTGQVPAGQISQNTFDFLKNLQNPKKNDRDWFRSHEPAFRQAEKEWQAFVGKVQKKFSESDNEIPILPPKDVIHRIYRDVRFSSDKTPYKKSFSMSTSRGGRKGLFGAYHLSISPNNKSLIAGGLWQPGKDELASIRQEFLNRPEVFRAVIEGKEFVQLFGKAKASKSGERSNVFGGEDQLKVAPKGIDKGHKDIDLLKLRSVAVVHHFKDEEVLAEDFMDKLKDIVRVMTPFIHLLNDFISLPNNNGDAAAAVAPATGNGNGNGNGNARTSSNVDEDEAEEEEEVDDD